MNAQNLRMPDGSPSNHWFCSSCRFVSAAQDLAETCCVCRDCGQPCDKEKDGYHSSRQHRACADASRLIRRREQMDKATEVTEYEGMLYSDDYSGGQDGYFRDMEEFVEDYLDHVEWQEDEPPERPEFLFCTTEVRPHWIGVDDVLERMADDMYEDAARDVQGLKELESAFEVFYAANAGMKSYQTDYSRKIRIQWPAEVAS